MNDFQSRKHPKESPVPLSTPAQAAIDQALSDLASAQLADQNLTTAQGALARARDAADAQQAADLKAHQAALDSAHRAIDALSAELGLAPAPAAKP